MRTLVLVDGIDGAGKSSLIAEIVEQIFEENKKYSGDYSVVETYPFPSRMPKQEDKKDPLTQTFFYLNDFHQVMRNRDEEYLVCDRSFVSTMAYQGFNEKPGEPLTNARFEAIFQLGSESFVSNDFKNPESKIVFFLHVRCSPEAAATRIMGRTSDRVGEIEEIEDREELVERLSTLRDRLDLCYPYIRMNIANLHPNHHFIFMEVDSTDQDADTMAQEVLEHMKPILWPPQPSLPLK